MRDRFETLLYGIGEAAGYLAIPPTTLRNWVYGSAHQHGGGTTSPVVTAISPERRHEPSMPFIGLAEAYVLAAFRKAGVPMQRIRPAIDVLARELGLQHALASKQEPVCRRATTSRFSLRSSLCTSSAWTSGLMATPG